MSSVILASRDQLCINESLATFQDKNQMCKVKRKAKACAYYNNIERAADTMPESGIGDIESLKKHGQKRKLCPYYISRDLAAKADLIFLPYNYLVDPRIRKSLAINLEECVVIVDEAHNVLRIFEDSSSASFSAKEIAVALSELDFILDFTVKARDDEMYAETMSSMPNLDTSQVYAVKDVLSKLEKDLVEFTKTMKTEGDYTGEEVIKMFESCGVTAQNAVLLSSAITNILDALSVLNLAGGSNKGKGLSAMAELVDLLYLDASHSNTREKMKSFYRFHVSEVPNKFGGGKDTEYHLWCFHPGFSLNSLVRCNIRTLILTSGTLKPMDSFQAELNADFPIRLQNDHVINAEKQINYQVIGQGPDGQELISTFQSRSNPKYLASLGQALVEIARVVPDGLLIFFASYAWMDACLVNWKQIGVWERLNHWKQCFVEPKDRASLSRMVDEFRAKVRHVSRIGACFMAVCRGKVSEGIDFADADARAVVITGIPYPSVFDPKVKLKKKFLDGCKLSGGEAAKTLSGTEWYNLEAFRAINQSVGRVIRHKDDFGAVLLLDKRFGAEGSASKLSSWLPKAKKFNCFKASIKSLEDFFEGHQYTPKLKPAAIVHKQMSSTLDLKRPFTSSVAVQAAMKNREPPAKRKKIVIKSRSAASSNCDSKPEETVVTKPKTDIQQFVLSLKERLEKKELKKLIACIKVYKEKADVKPLAGQLKMFYDEKTVARKDILEFKSFVKLEDEEAISTICDAAAQNQ